MTNRSDVRATELGIDETEASLRKRYLELGKADEERLKALNEMARKYADPVIEDFYKHILSTDATRAFFKDAKLLGHVKQLQKDYFLELTSGNYDQKYVEDRVKIGATHERIGLDIKWYLGSYNFYIRNVGQRIFDAYKDDPKRAAETIFSLLKLIFFDMGLAIDTYVKRREQIIGAQQEEIRELSTPVLRLKDRLLVVPIIGIVDSRRAYQLTDQLLRAIRAHRAKVVVVDITGVPTVDSAVANHLIQTVQAARLLGAHSIITGVSPEIAQTLVRIGVDVTRLNAVGDLQEGIVEAERLLEGA